MSKVLTIGPDYTKLGGGIVSVLSTYAKSDDQFDFLPTYSSENNIVNILEFPFKVIQIVVYLLTHKDISIVHIHGASRLSFLRKYFFFIIIKYLLGKKLFIIYMEPNTIYFMQSLVRRKRK